MVSKPVLVVKIKEKKELSGIADEIVLGFLLEYVRKRNIFLENIRPSQIKIVVKDIRAELRKYVGRFRRSLKDRSKLLEQGRIKELLRTHTSTEERLSFYPKLRSIIKKLKVTSILDLACGLNPLALATPKIKYYASDIKDDELTLIKKYFEKNNIKGKTFIYDIRKIKRDLPGADLCLLFKVLDIIEKKGHKLAEKILKTVECKTILVSFPTKKLSGRPMRHPEREWLEKLLNRLNYPFKIFRSENEIFYLIKKH